jgi:hypothetical protein
MAKQGGGVFKVNGFDTISIIVYFTKERLRIFGPHYSLILLKYLLNY